MVNKQLLEWAVENIDKWEEGWSYLRADFSSSPVFYTKTDKDWYNTKTEWRSNELTGSCDWFTLEVEIENLSHPQVITKEEWQEAKNKKNNIFTQDMLVPGLHVLECANGEKYLVIQDNLAISYKQRGGISWNRVKDLFNTTDKNYFVMKVYETAPIAGRYLYGDDKYLTLIWERSPGAKEDKELKELKEQYEILGKKIAAIEKSSSRKS